MIDCSKCPNPGSCCGPFPMDKDLLEAHKELREGKVINEYPFGDRVVVLTEDFRCVFWDRKEKKCKIYKYRPQVCHDFGSETAEKDENLWMLMCPYFKPNGQRRSEAKEKQISRRFSHHLDDLDKKNQEKIRRVK